MTTQTQESHQNHENFTNSTHWYRLAFMLLFALLLQLAGAVMWALCAIQFLYAVITGQENLNLKQLGASIARYIHQVLNYVSYNSDEKPYPFSEWPVSEVSAEHIKTSADTDNVIAEQTINTESTNDSEEK